jgi:alkanesulfonate monooxygenase SsuD/methylene tetrahydromethanopterin reductase-like flavin-dependent oxidoreductase (luciferase family)
LPGTRKSAAYRSVARRTGPRCHRRSSINLCSRSPGRHNLRLLHAGNGHFDAEFDAIGIPVEHRVDRFAETAQIITGWLRNGEVDFAGEHYRVEMELGLPQVRPGGPPILIGASQPRMMRLTAEYADMWGRIVSVAVGLLGDRPTFGPYDMVNLGADEGEIADRLLQMQAEGVDHVQFCLAPATPQGVEALAGVVETVR